MSSYSWLEIRNETKQLTQIALPAIFAQLAQIALSVSDVLMAGNYSDNALAAVGTGANLFMVIFSFFYGLMIALNPMVSTYNGQSRFKAIGKTFQLGIFAAVLFGLLTIVILSQTDWILSSFGVEQAITETTAGYLSALSYGVVFVYLFLALRSCNEGLFATRAIMICSLVAIPFNIILNYWFIFGGYGLKPMGAIGVGYATSIVWFLLFLFLLIYTAKNKSYSSLNIFNNIKFPRKALIKEYFSIGTPIALGMVLEISMFGGIGILIARLGEQLTSAHQIAMNIATVAFMVPLGLSIAITARVGYWLGKSDHRQMRLAGYSGIGLSILFQIITVTIMLVFRHELVSFYNQDPLILEIAASLIFLAAIFQFSDGLQVNSAGALRGMKDTKIPMIYMGISYWIFGLPIGYYLAEYQGMAVRGYWIGIIVGLFIAAILLLGRFIRKTNQLNT